MAGSDLTLTRDDALLYLKRFPSQGVSAVVFNALLVAGGNALVLWLLMRGDLQAVHLILLVMAEAVLLIAIGWLSGRTVPRRDWLEPPKPWRESAPALLFALVWMAGAYGITLLILEQLSDFFVLLRSPHAWIDARMHWALGYTTLLAVGHAVGDRVHYATHGGPYQSSVAPDAMARVLTLLLGGIPFAMPFFAVVIGGFKTLEFIARKAKLAPGQSIAGSIALLAVAFGGFALVGALIDSGVAGWAIGFVLAKLIAELMLAAVPLVMMHVAKHGP